MRRPSFFHGEIGYSTTERAGFLGVRFIGPGGNRLERMTACKKLDATFHTEARRVIDDAFTVVAPEPDTRTWDAAVAEVERTAPDLRSATVGVYRRALAAFLETVKPGDNAADVAPEAATRFSASRCLAHSSPIDSHLLK